MDIAIGESVRGRFAPLYHGDSGRVVDRARHPRFGDIGFLLLQKWINVTQRISARDISNIAGPLSSRREDARTYSLA